MARALIQSLSKDEGTHDGGELRFSRHPESQRRKVIAGWLHADYPEDCGRGRWFIPPPCGEGGLSRQRKVGRGSRREKHMHRYLAEFSFRYNHRIALKIGDVERRDAALKGIEGKRLTYRRIDEAAHA